jgi:hypothetical protein
MLLRYGGAFGLVRQRLSDFGKKGASPFASAIKGALIGERCVDDGI